MVAEESAEGVAAEGIAGDMVTLVEERVTEEIVKEMPAEGIIGGTTDEIVVEDIVREMAVRHFIEVVAQEEIVKGMVVEEIAKEVARRHEGGDGGESAEGAASLDSHSLP